MVAVYITDVRQWDEDSLYHKELALLPKKRQQHVEGYKHMPDKRRSLAGSILLCKAFKEHYPTVDMNRLEFAKGADGKPYIKEYPEFHFNISHSGNYTVCAVSNTEIGIDIQQLREVKTDIAARFFSNEERAGIEAFSQGKEQPEAAKKQMLFRFWAAKEAYVKLTGKGMKELQSFTVDLETGHISYRNENEAVAVWLKEYDIGSDYVLTVCAKEPDFGDLQVYKIL